MLCSTRAKSLGLVAYSVAAVALAPSVAAFAAHGPLVQSSRSPLRSSTSAGDDAFPAFTDRFDGASDGAAKETALVEERPSTVAVAAAATVDKGVADKKSWQAKLDDVLNPTTNQADRQILLSDLLKSNRDIQDSVRSALQSGNIDSLLTPTAKRYREGTRAVARQVTNDILPKLTRSPPPMPPPPASMEKVGTRILGLIANQLQKGVQDFQKDMQNDPLSRISERLSKQSQEFVQEAQNIFLETPLGLDGPKYQVVGTSKSADHGDDDNAPTYEIRDYEGYAVAATAMPDSEDMVSAGTAFNTLAAYLFGANSEGKAMAMTTPVATTSLGEMRFYLNEVNIPQPLDAKVAVDSKQQSAGINSGSGSSTAGVSTSTTATTTTPVGTTKRGAVQIEAIPAARLAVRQFTGFVTDGEVARQKDVLLQELEMDGIELDVPHGSKVPHVIFQYNPPYTLPMVRRNEIAVPVRGPQDQVEMERLGSSLKEEWSVDDNDDSDDNGSDKIVVNVNGSVA